MADSTLTMRGVLLATVWFALSFYVYRSLVIDYERCHARLHPNAEYLLLGGAMFAPLVIIGFERNCEILVRKYGRAHD